ncbi:MAG TPA: hypothetical protein VFU02_17675 [Polyangiaceae bacterium]|nr:hypothetical protein [Polyangiaceae bacterium]
MSFFTGVEDQFDAHWRDASQRRAAERRAEAKLEGKVLTELEALEITFTRPPTRGDRRSQVLFEIEQEELQSRQTAQHVVGAGCSVRLGDGTCLGPGAPLTVAVLGGPGALGELRAAGVVSEIHAEVAFERSMPADVEYAVFAERITGKGGRVFNCGDAVTEDDFDLPKPRPLSVAEEAAEIVLARLGRGVPTPPPMSEWADHLARGRILRNPRFKPKAT